MKNSTTKIVLALALLATFAWCFGKAQDGLASYQSEQASELESTINGDY